MNGDRPDAAAAAFPATQSEFTVVFNGHVTFDGVWVKMPIVG